MSVIAIYVSLMHLSFPPCSLRIPMRRAQALRSAQVNVPEKARPIRPHSSLYQRIKSVRVVVRDAWNDQDIMDDCKYQSHV